MEERSRTTAAGPPSVLTLATLVHLEQSLISVWYATSDAVPPHQAYEIAPWEIVPGVSMPKVLLLHPDTLEQLRAEAGGILPGWWRHIRDWKLLLPDPTTP
jgi:hypothetical protein